jgi:glycosyltransferase involved in cell wall biosynthesis
LTNISSMQNQVKPEVSVVIASLNEERAIGDCIKKIKKVYHELKINGEIVVADNSTDKTAEIAKELGAKVVTPNKMGYGNAFLFGIKNSSGRYVVMADADGTYDFNDLPKFLKPLYNQNAAFVFGSRFKGHIKKGAMPGLHRYIGNPILTLFLNLTLSTNISDAHCGIRSFSRFAWDKLDHRLMPEDFCSEMLKQISKKKYTIAEVPIVYYEREGNPKASTLLHGWRVFSFLFIHVFFDKLSRR